MPSASSPERPPPLDGRLCGLALVAGVGCGLLAAAFRFVLHAVEALHERVVAGLAPFPGPGWLAVVVLAAAGAGLAGWLTFRLAPEASGSGIPHVEGRLADGTAMRWRRLVPVKFAGGLLTLGSGLSMGREGPTVQMGGAVADALGRAFTSDAATLRALLAAGGGAGLAAAFDAPLAGVVFVIEELRMPLEARTYATALIANLSASAVLLATLGDAPAFRLPSPPALPASALPWCAAVGVVAGLLGVAFNRSLLGALAVVDGLPTPRWALTAAAGAAAGLLACVLPAVIADGEPVTARILRGELPAGHPAAWLLAVVVLKLGLTVASYASGAPGGIFAPLLLMGAALGTLLGQAASGLEPGVATGPALAMAGMTALFVAVVRVPITAVVLIEEMTSGQAQLLGLLTAALAAWLVASALRDVAIYEALRARDERRRRAA